MVTFSHSFIHIVMTVKENTLVYLQYLPFMQDWVGHQGRWNPQIHFKMCHIAKTVPVSLSVNDSCSG